MNIKKTASLLPEDPSTKSIGEFVADDYRAAEIFEKYGIDFCCGGNVPLGVACRQKGIDPAPILREIETAKSEPIERNLNFAAWDIPFLADYIVTVHHAYVRESSGQIASYAQKIVEVHGVRHPELRAIAATFDRIAADLVPHLREEEEVFFPAVKRAAGARKGGMPPQQQDIDTIKADLVRLRREHEEVGDAIHEIRRLANGYAVPDDACNTFAVTYRKLKEFEDDLHKHVHLENNILFLKAEQL